MIRIIELNFDEIAIDPAECSDVINRACEREKAAVTGICANEHSLIVILGFGVKQTGYYRLAQFPGFSKEEIIGEINGRWTAGFSVIGSFIAGKSLWGLFVRMEPNPES